MQKDFMQGMLSNSWNSYDRGRFTDLTLALLQGSGRYDVKYGSGGFSSHGLGAGCGFGMGNIQKASTGAGARHVCSSQRMSTCNERQCFSSLQGLTSLLHGNDELAKDEGGIDAGDTHLEFLQLEDITALERCIEQSPAGCNRCLADWAGEGICQTKRLGDDMTFATPVRGCNFSHCSYRSKTSRDLILPFLGCF
jgi:hypothetical protein